jgi:hypothetical protein
MLLIAALVFAQKGFADASKWLDLLAPTGLMEIQAKTISIEQNANVTSISYAYSVTNADGETTTYHNTMNISDINLELGDKAQEFQANIPIEYLPDAPFYSIVSKKRLPSRYSIQIEDSIISRWFSDLVLPVFLSVISVFCLVILVRETKNFVAHSYKAYKRVPYS